LRFLGSRVYVQGKLEGLTEKQLNFLRGLLQGCGHLRFRKEFAANRHVPYGNTREYKKCVLEADVSKVAKLVKIVGMLLQTKVYLFWEVANPVLFI
jgi:hypothetical protein